MLLVNMSKLMWYGLQKARIGALTHLHGEVDAEVDVFGPDIVGGLGVLHGEDAAVEVALPRGLPITRDRDDGGAGPVPGDQVSGPSSKKKKKCDELHTLVMS